jgi:hypothetical protein
MKTEQDMIMNRMKGTPEPTVPFTYIRQQEFYCTQCDNTATENKAITEPSDKLRIIWRLMRLSEDYEGIKTSIESIPDGIILRVWVPDFDMSEVRAVQNKQEETGFITVEELTKLQRAGFRRIRDVPPNPMPHSLRRYKERQRQKMFVGDPRS